MRYADRSGPSRTRLCRDGCSSLSTTPCINAKYQSSDEESGDCMLTSDMANWVRHGRFWIEKEWVWRVVRVVQA